MDLAALKAHLGFTAPQHAAGCTATGWDVDYRIQPDVLRGDGDEGHSCPSYDCWHGDRAEQLEVRILCRTCGAVRLLQAEQPLVRGHRTTSQLGYGTAPRKVGSLWVYTGPPPQLGMLSDTPGDPLWYLVARRRADRLTPDDVVGAIWPADGKRLAPGFTASTDLVPFGEFDWDGTQSFAFKHQARSDDLHFRTIAAAVKWIEQQLADTASAKVGAEGSTG
ncbi:hypothetical protein ACFV84_35065 [Kitasatospora sp. NPDC059811]|uniref:hypothetical protein n=1 Tax=Streptomycetaceae TaxID=2062 RepID=UPI0007AF671C|nr:hypothetical protein [Streptomyces sp. MJM8645]